MVQMNQHEQREAATLKVAAMLRYPSDSKNIPSLREQLLREKRQIERQIKGQLDAQIEVLSKEAQVLDESRERVEDIKTALQSVDKVQSISKNAVPEFSRIRQLRTVLGNFEQTQRFVDNFTNMKQDLQYIKDLMDEDGPIQDATAEMPNLVKIHYLLTQQRIVYNEAMAQSARSSADTKHVIKKHFQALLDLVDEFDHTILTVASELLTLTKAGNYQLIVKTAKIVAFEEKQDLQHQILKEAKESGQINSEEAYNYLIQKVGSLSKGDDYKKRFFQKIQESVPRRFDIKMKKVLGDPRAMLDKLQFIYEDLNVYKKDLSRRLPKRWQILDEYAKYYHEAVNNVLNTILNDLDPTAENLLDLLHWVEAYKVRTRKILGSESPVLKYLAAEPLLGGKEDALYDEFLSLNIKKLKKWSSEVLVAERLRFEERVIPPDSDMDNKFYLANQDDLFKIIRDTAEFCQESQKDRIIAGCATEIASILNDRMQHTKNFAEAQVRLLESQQQHKKKKKREEGVDEEIAIAPGLLEYIIALENDQLRAKNEVVRLQARYNEAVSRKYQSQVNQTLEAVCQNLYKSMYSLNALHMRVMYSDMLVPFGELFDSSSWSKGKSIKLIVETIQDYAADMDTHMYSEVKRDLTVLVTETLILLYFKALRDNKADLKFEKNAAHIREDARQIMDSLTEPPLEMDADYLPNLLRPVEYLLQALEVPKDDLLELFKMFREEFWDAPPELFEAIISSRKSLSSKETKEIMAAVNMEALHIDQPATVQSEHTFLCRFNDIFNDALF